MKEQYTSIPKESLEVGFNVTTLAAKNLFEAVKPRLKRKMGRDLMDLYVAIAKLR